LAVEVPIVTDAAGVHPISLGPLPDGVANCCRCRQRCNSWPSKQPCGAPKRSPCKPC
jgi:alpha-galactosidase/6-phospho-beta-glucosidase family protein